MDRQRIRSGVQRVSLNWRSPASQFSSGKIVAAAIHHRPVGVVLRFSAEICDRPAGVIPADHFLQESA
jgi:hypothetical protein